MRDIRVFSCQNPGSSCSWMSSSSASITTQLIYIQTNTLRARRHSYLCNVFNLICSSHLGLSEILSTAGALWNIHHKVYSVNFFFFFAKRLNWDPSQPSPALLCFADGGGNVALPYSERCHFSPTHLFHHFSFPGLKIGLVFFCFFSFPGACKNIQYWKATMWKEQFEFWWGWQLSNTSLICCFRVHDVFGVFHLVRLFNRIRSDKGWNWALNLQRI